MYVLGIDPGVKGGVALLDDLNLICLKSFSKDRFENVKMLKETLNTTDNLYTFIEEGHAFKGQGVTSMFNFGFFHGYIYGVFAGESKIEYIKPRDWQKFHGLWLKRQSTKGLSQKEKQKIQNEKKRERKKMSIQKAKELYPEWADKIKNHDGMAEAILIARYGLFLLGKGGE